ncbi:RteC domain-containing protein [Chryseolinea sp. H1M3-3]|uniref:RteC domain-containing protein n=1 Tax=Chryseolinea sp. H1M3-3 TaxID=3034144 RepID=UPI0023EAC4DE|nr:RteC domain-containing protein [Chryseolinea sp. H1M3-3]
MELKIFAEELQARMKTAMDQITLDQPDVVIRTSQLITYIESTVLELKRYVLKYKFKTVEEEIEFFKTIKPIFISQLWYHKKLFKIRLIESFNDMETRMRYYQRLLKSLENFMLKHREFYHYTLAHSNHMDEKYFTRVNASKGRIENDERFSAHYDEKVARILTNELVKEYVFGAIQKIKAGAPGDSSMTPISWTGSKTDLIELIYGLHATGVFNKAASDLKQIASYFETVFNVSLGNYYRTFQEIRLRKSGQVNFLDTVRKNLIQRINESDA